MIARIILLLAAMPLLIYPGILIAGIMGLAAQPSTDADILTVTVAKAFMWASLLYPVGYAVGVLVSLKYRLIGTVISVVHLLVCLALLATWYYLSSINNL